MQETKVVKKDSMLNDVEDLDPGTLNKVNDFVDDDLLSCFLWAAGENAVAQPGWESPSATPLKGIPLPPAMPPGKCVVRQQNRRTTKKTDKNPQMQ